MRVLHGSSNAAGQHSPWQTKTAHEQFFELRRNSSRCSQLPAAVAAAGALAAAGTVVANPAADAAAAAGGWARTNWPLKRGRASANFLRAAYRTVGANWRLAFFARKRSSAALRNAAADEAGCSGNACRQARIKYGTLAPLQLQHCHHGNGSAEVTTECSGGSRRACGPSAMASQT
jgi:hypothetical protein